MPRERQAPKLLFSCGNNFSLSSFLQPVFFAILFLFRSSFYSTRPIKRYQSLRINYRVYESGVQRRDVNSWEHYRIYFAFAYLNPLSAYNGWKNDNKKSSFHRNVISFRNSCTFRCYIYRWFVNLCVLSPFFYISFATFPHVVEVYRIGKMERSYVMLRD